ncbi:hypothetical protein D8B22_11445 [Verminephrobacter aporrectodeae subsp. tuberculatae]|nr:hypothetical protein [Verminephrobacter aporrectodeae subsp. tuberculatae]MCW8169706.1 hypothetical protein [Verminephrobacter aporrectodeae subsp. tuberculatae]
MESIRLQKENIVFTESEARRLDSQLTDARARNAKLEELKNLFALVEETNKCVETLALARQDNLRTIAPLRMDASIATFGKLRPVQRTLTKLVSALREELNLPRDDDAFMEQLKAMEQRAWAMVNKTYGIDPPRPMPEIVEPVRPSGK